MRPLHCLRCLRLTLPPPTLSLFSPTPPQPCCLANVLPPDIVAEIHMCTRDCGRQLSCGCSCGVPCHRGACPPCGRTSREPLVCHCGRTVVPPPVRCGTKLPPCPYPCQRGRSCGHPARHNCHEHEQCPPCTELVYRECLGGHESLVQTFCHREEVPCGETCGKPLPCGQHTCIAACHAGDCLKVMKDAIVMPRVGKSKVEQRGCGLRCGQRMMCGHTDESLCHPGRSCPVRPCSAHVQRRCKCGHRVKKVLCNYGECRRLRAALGARSEFAERGSFPLEG